MQKRGLLIYAHYDAGHQLRPYVEHALTQAKLAGLQLIFVTTSELRQDALDRVDTHCDRVIVRADNRGYDFYSWKVALAGVETAGFDFIITANSSVFGPIANLPDLLDQMYDARCADLVGITRSLQAGLHLQSYFLMWKRPLLGSPWFEEFWRRIEPYADKSAIIDQYELTLARQVRAAGFRWDSLVRDSRLLYKHLPRFGLLRSRARTNPPLRHPLRLLEAGSPFVKVSLFQANPHRVDLEPIRRHCLARGYPASCLQDFFNHYLT